MPCPILNFKYINENVKIFKSINGFERRFRNLEKASMRKGGCSSCTRKGLEKEFELYVIEEIIKNKRLDILKKLDKNMIFRYRKLYQVSSLISGGCLI